MEIMETKQIAATKANVELAINNIKAYAQEKGYQIKGNFTLGELKFDSKNKEKVCRNYLWRLDKKMGMSVANRFLHFLFKKALKNDTAPYIDYSEKELKIKEAKRAWNKLKLEAEKLQEAYKLEKGNFYK